MDDNIQYIGNHNGITVEIYHNRIIFKHNYLYEDYLYENGILIEIKSNNHKLNNKIPSNRNLLYRYEEAVRYVKDSCGHKQQYIMGIDPYKKEPNRRLLMLI